MITTKELIGNHLQFILTYYDVDSIVSSSPEYPIVFKIYYSRIHMDPSYFMYEGELSYSISNIFQDYTYYKKRYYDRRTR